MILGWLFWLRGRNANLSQEIETRDVLLREIFMIFNKRDMTELIDCLGQHNNTILCMSSFSLVPQLIYYLFQHTSYNIWFLKNNDFIVKIYVIFYIYYIVELL